MIVEKLGIPEDDHKEAVPKQQQDEEAPQANDEDDMMDLSKDRLRGEKYHFAMQRFYFEMNKFYEGVSSVHRSHGHKAPFKRSFLKTNRLNKIKGYCEAIGKLYRLSFDPKSGITSFSL